MCALNQSAVHYRADLSFSHRGKTHVVYDSNARVLEEKVRC